MSPRTKSRDEVCFFVLLTEPVKSRALFLARLRDILVGFQF